MLRTKLKHIENCEQIKELLKNHENVMVCCGRMGAMCTPVYAIMERLESKYPHVQMRDMEFDMPDASFIRNLPECASFMGLPFTVYFKNGAVVKATTSIQNEKQVTNILEDVFTAGMNA